MNKTNKRMFAGLIVLMIFVPLGLLATGTAFGEWGSDDLKEEIGYVPEGIAQGEQIWKAPLPDYSLPGQSEDFFHSSVGYYVSAFLGLVLVGGLMLFIGNLVSMKEKSNDNS
jgi:hypothetical protein